MGITKAQLFEGMQAFPLHRQFGFEIVEHGAGTCHARCEVGPAHLNYGGVVHGGVMYLLMDVASYCAGMTLVPDGFSVTTHDFHASIMRPTPGGVVLDLHAQVQKPGRSVYFIDVKASVAGKPVASARVTKTVVPLPG